MEQFDFNSIHINFMIINSIFPSTNSTIHFCFWLEYLKLKHFDFIHYLVRLPNIDVIYKLLF